MLLTVGRDSKNVDQLSKNVWLFILLGISKNYQLGFFPGKNKTKLFTV